MHRRSLAALAASTFAASVVTGAARADDGGYGEGSSGEEPGSEERGSLDAALNRFTALPGTKSYLVQAGQGGSVGRIAHQPDLMMLIVSAYKTFVLGQYLRDVEAGLLSEDEQLPVNDNVRDLGSPVFSNLAGTTTARSVLEAMMAHSDNTATNAATLRVGAERVRRLIAQAGLRSTLIPDSTRIFSSYIFGAPLGVDLGWPEILRAIENAKGLSHPLLNEQQTLASSAQDLVSWYEQVLSGALFAKQATLTEFKRIQSMSVQIGRAVPTNTLAYAKGGEAPEVFGFSAKCFAGQMIEGRTPVTFSFIVNWEGLPGQFPEIEAEFFAAIKNILRIVKQSLR